MDPRDFKNWEEVENNDGLCCSICIIHFTESGINRHHTTPKRFNGKDNIENLWPLCSRCHGKMHKFYIDKAIKIALHQNPNFFEDCFHEYSQKYGKWNFGLLKKEEEEEWRIRITS